MGNRLYATYCSTVLCVHTELIDLLDQRLTYTHTDHRHVYIQVKKITEGKNQGKKISSVSSIYEGIGVLCSAGNLSHEVISDSFHLCK